MAAICSGKFRIYAATAVAALLIAACPAHARARQAAGPADADGLSAAPPSGDGSQGDTPPAPNAPSSNSDGNSDGSARLPETPQTQTTKHDDRIFGVMPNYLTVEGAHTLPPLSVGQKFKLAAEGTFDPYEFAIVGFLAGINQATDKDNSYGQGGLGYARRYGAGFADQALGNFMTGAVFPSLLHEDPRYYQLGHGKFWHRADYALSRIVITPKDAGGYQFNYSEFLGNAAAAGLAMTYRDEADRNITNVAVTWSEQMAVDCLGNELKEFWPDIRRKVFKKKRPQEE